MVSKVRVQRIADRIREELSEMLITETQDPRLSGISVTDVTVDRELDYANIFVSAVEGSVRAQEALEGFQHAQGFLRSELARRIQLRAFPRLRFHWDYTYERADRIEDLLATLRLDEEPEIKGSAQGAEQHNQQVDESNELGNKSDE